MLQIRVKRSLKRRSSGQALVEGSAFLCILLMIFTSCLMMFLNLAVIVLAQQKSQVAATQAAQYIMGQRFWLGAIRTDYDATTTSAKARAVADSVLRAVGLPASSSFSATDVPAVNGTTVTVVTLGVSGIPLLNGMQLPIPVNAVSASSTAQDITQGWRAVSIECADPTNPTDQSQWRTAMVPCYDYFIGAQSSNNQSSPEPVALLQGPSLVGHVTVLRSGSGACDIATTNSNQQVVSKVSW